MRGAAINCDEQTKTLFEFEEACEKIMKCYGRINDFLAAKRTEEKGKGDNHDTKN